MEDLSILQEYNVRVYKKDEDIFDIINSILGGGNISEEAFYVVDIGKVVKQVQKWNEFLPDVKPYYAVKCNPNELVLKVLSSLDVNFDCASKNEIASVMNITEDASRIIFANPCKMSNQIKYARANDVDLMTFDSDHELYKIKLYHPYSDLILRIKVDDSESVCQFGCKFGVDVDDVKKLLEIAKTLSLNVVGISFHVGSGCKNNKQFENAIRDARICFDIAKDVGFNFKILDIGGGFEDGTFEESAQVIKDAIYKNFPSSPPEEEIRIIAEPGRFFVSPSHTLVVNVIGKKDTTDRDTGEKTFVYYLNDGMYGSFNCVHFDHAKPLICPFNERDGKRYKSKIFGPTCDSMDKISDEVLLPELAIGEWCYIENFGAYTCAAASTFNGFTQIHTINIMTT
jgi:ornithine decarboxylase